MTDKTKTYVYVGAAVLVLILVGVAVAVYLGGGDPTPAAGAAVAAGVAAAAAAKSRQQASGQVDAAKGVAKDAAADATTAFLEEKAALAKVEAEVKAADRDQKEKDGEKLFGG